MFIYGIANDFDDNVYVGKHEGDCLIDRWNTHLVEVRGECNCYIHNAMRKHGVEHFFIFPIWSGYTLPSELCTLEKYHVKCFKTKCPDGYNLTDGGEGTSGFHHSEKTKAEYSRVRKGQIQHPNTRKAASINLTNLNQNSPSFIEKRNEGKKRYAQTPEYRQWFSINNPMKTEKGKSKRAESPAPMTGKVWITDGKSNRAVDKLALIDEGWYRGKSGGSSKGKHIKTQWNDLDYHRRWYEARWGEEYRKPMINRKCDWCDQLFQPGRNVFDDERNGRFCSKSCLSRNTHYMKGHKNNWRNQNDRTKADAA
jgi:group I intron endonuclease